MSWDWAWYAAWIVCLIGPALVRNSPRNRRNVAFLPGALSILIYLPLALTTWGTTPDGMGFDGPDTQGANADVFLVEGIALLVVGAIGLGLAAIGRATERRVRRQRMPGPRSRTPTGRARRVTGELGD
jgi:hypothetical protein